MIYDFGSYNYIFDYLKSNLPKGAIIRIGSAYKLEKYANSNDMVIFYGWTPGLRRVQIDLIEHGVTVVPDGKTSLVLWHKASQLKLLSNITLFPMRRVICENPTGELKEYTVPIDVCTRFVVVKIGNSHQGKDKYLKEIGAKVVTREDVIFEEYFECSRSIRIILMNKEPRFIVEHTNKSSKYGIDGHWIKNYDPIETTYSIANRYNLGIGPIDRMLLDAQRIVQFLDMGYAGIDYVVQGERVGLLEVNDMIGLPDNDEEIKQEAKDYWLSLCKKHIEEYGG